MCKRKRHYNLKSYGSFINTAIVDTLCYGNLVAVKFCNFAAKQGDLVSVQLSCYDIKEMLHKSSFAIA